MHNDTYMPTLESERLVLRRITKDDVDDMFAYACDPNVSRFTTWDSHRTLEDTLKYINVVLTKYENNEPTDWGIVDKQYGKFIGTVGFVYVNSNHSRAEIGYALSKKYWEQGIMTEAVREIIRYGFQELALNRIEARAEVPNIGSWRVMEKVNMKFEGILRQHLFAKGAFHDLKLYSILADDYKALFAPSST
ncbi:GNAT family N-acetyltransferase [Alicyclobacillus fastidiosus]|uniref:GNAT family N-acetyltransferase n=1 Tax=Alicyclobacillus fastidiosus TaxID=392011 RepID=A0ABY6ZCM6_9BACL|nr:GNAT family protein [Alicyclobacillus fastidiosus]WAH40011.1 GNAT family N-acetyltransferase [Alicyclobacillus fastidiosus]GMA61306.1 N-acetyltransferase [Alicyclobacillus fastidiosus]